MTSKIALVFKRCRQEKRPALITYTVAGDNTKSNSLKILNSISRHADILELGFPHNTPIADGGQIQGSSHRALKNGIKLKDVFQIVKKFKKYNVPSEKECAETIGFRVASAAALKNPKPKTAGRPIPERVGGPLGPRTTYVGGLRFQLE